MSETNADRAANQWQMFAHDYGGKFFHVGSRRYVELHYLSKPIVAVTVTEDPDGEYRGWIYADKDEPCMIWPSKGQLEICFPYGTQAAQERGSGRVVRLKIDTTASVADAPPAAS